MINLRIDLLPAEIATKGENALGAAVFAARPPITCSIQTVSDFIVVRGRHLAQNLGNEPRRIYGFAIGVPRTGSSRRRTDLRIRTVGVHAARIRYGTKDACIA